MERAYLVWARRVCEYSKKRWRNTTSKSWNCARQGGYKQDRRDWEQERLSSTQDTRTAMHHILKELPQWWRKSFKVAYRMGAGECKANGARFRKSHKRISSQWPCVTLPQTMQRRERRVSSMIGWGPHCVREQKRRSLWWWETMPK